MKFIAYYRVSTQRQAASGRGVAWMLCGVGAAFAAWLYASSAGTA